MVQYQTQIGIHQTEYGYEQLANAIILQAVKDYRDALKRLKKHPNNSTALSTKLDAEQFLRSNRFAMLTSIDPEMLIQKFRAEVA